MDILNVQEKVHLDNSIVGYEYHNHIPFGSPKYGNNDEIRIAVPEIDNFTLPSESYLYVEGNLRLEADPNNASKTAALISNAAAFMFSDIRYLLNGVEVDSVRNVGVTSTMKGYLSFSASDETKLSNAGWSVSDGKAPILDSKGNFSISVPLKYLIGFAEDFKKVVMNARQELLLIRANDDSDAIVNTNAAEKLKLVIEKLVWRVPHIKVGLRQELMFMKMIEKNKLMQLAFRSWEIHEYPTLPQTMKHSWSIKTAPQLETPRYIILGFQTSKKGDITKNMTEFNDINIVNITAFLNGKRYPYENLNLDYDTNKYAVLYDMYARFQKVYYNDDNAKPLLNLEQFKLRPLYGIDCTYQQEGIHKSGVEIRIEFSTKNNVPKDTVAYCLILHDKMFEYSPYNKMVTQVY